MKYTQFNKLPWNKYQIPKPFQKKFSFVINSCIAPKSVNDYLDSVDIYFVSKRVETKWMNLRKIVAVLS